MFSFCLNACKLTGKWDLLMSPVEGVKKKNKNEWSHFVSWGSGYGVKPWERI